MARVEDGLTETNENMTAREEVKVEVEPPVEIPVAAGTNAETPPPLAAEEKEGEREAYSPPKNMMMKENLALRLKDQMTEDSRLEFLKEELALKADFNLEDAFDFFDLEKRGRLSHLDISDGLAQLAVYPLREECKMIVERYDINKDGMLDRSEFAEIFLPHDPITSGQLRRRPSFNRDHYYTPKLVFTTRTQQLIGDVLRSQMVSERVAETVRQRLKLETSNLEEAFQALDKANKGHISKWDLGVVLDEYRVVASRN